MTAHERNSGVGCALKQGSLLLASATKQMLRDALCESRAVVDARTKLVDDSALLVVLSQDCDISNVNEKYIEIAVARKCRSRETRNNVSLTRARNTRKLHFFYDHCYWEVHIDLISVVEKALFSDQADLAQIKYLPEKTKKLLITWRINRYSRAPLPDVFNRGFVSGYLHQSGNALAVFLETNRDSILDLYVYIQPETEDVDDYLVSITVLMCQQCSDELFVECENVLRTHLRLLHHDEHNSLTFIQIAPELIPDDVTHVMDFVAKPEDFTLQDLFVMKRLSVDYLCFPE